MRHLLRLLLPFLIALVGCTTEKPEPAPPRQVVLTDAVSYDEVRPAVDALLARIEAIDDDGWPAGTAKREGKALVRVEAIVDRGCARQTDPIGLRNQVINALTRQGRLDLVGDAPSSRGSSSVNAERTYGAPVAKPSSRRKVPVTLALRGELVGTRFSLRLVDLRTDAVLVDTSSAIPTSAGP